MTLAPGFHPIPPGHLATIVTHLAMDATPPRPAPDMPGLALTPLAQDPARYRALFRLVGADWLWWSRLALPEAELAAILADPGIEALALEHRGAPAGMLELDFRRPGECELAFFGLAAPLRGTGAGRWLMNAALARAFARPVARLTVHTCTLDHPAALPFYLRSGFAPVRQEVEVMPDPRLTGLLPRDGAPQVPLAVEAGAPLG
jgi:GNAT superfamily N-acetyltransferase